MNILQINSSDSKGGVAKNTYRFKKRLEEFGHKMILFVSVKNTDDKNVFLIKPLNKFLKKISHFLKKDLQGYLTRKTTYLRANDIEFFNIKNLFKSTEYKKADIIHCRNLHGDYFNLKALKKISKEKPIVWTIHDMWAITGHCAHSFDCKKWQTGCHNCYHLNIYPAIKWDNTKYLWNKKKKIYDNLKINIVANSLWTKKKLEKSILKDQNIRLIYNGVDSTVFRKYDKEAIREKLNFPLDKKIIMFLVAGGKGNPWKGWKYVEKIINYYKDNKDIFFLCIGGRKDKQQLDKGNIKYIEYTDEDSLVAQYYSSADLLLYPSLADSFGLVVAESLACGTPVVTFKTGGIPEIVLHKKNGYLAEYKNTGELINGIKYIFGLSNAEFQEMSRHSIQRIKDNFELDIMVKNYLNLYQEILG